MKSKNTAMKLYYTEVSFIRPFQEQGIFPCVAESPEAAKAYMEKLFSDHPNLKIHRVIDSEDAPQLKTLIPTTEVEEDGEIKGEKKPKDDEPTLN